MIENKKRVFVTTNGCPRRRLDSSRLDNFFKINGWVVVRAPEEADYIIFVTCSFKQDKEEYCLSRIKEFLKYRGELIVAGCLPDIAGDRLKEIFNGKIIRTANLDKIDTLFDDFKVKFEDIPDTHLLYGIYFSWRQWLSLNLGIGKNFFTNCLTYGSYLLKNIRLGPKAYLRISRGCPERCAYCTITLAVGDLKSKKIQVCLREYRRLLQRGYRNIVLLADNLGAYGLDCGSSLSELLESLAEADERSLARWDIRDLHPKWVIRYQEVLLKYISQGKVTSMICAIQSGSNRILELMNRMHRIEEIAEVFARFREKQPGLFLSTQLIFGFPSETEEDFQATLRAIERIGFNFIMLYPYYDGQGSLSSGMSGKLGQEVIFSRLKRAVAFLQNKGIFCAIDEVSSGK